MSFWNNKPPRDQLQSFAGFTVIAGVLLMFLLPSSGPYAVSIESINGLQLVIMAAVMLILGLSR